MHPTGVYMEIQDDCIEINEPALYEMLSENLLDDDNPLIFDVGDNIFGVITELRFNYINSPKIKLSINAHLCSEDNISLTEEEEKAYIDKLSKKVQTEFVSMFKVFVQNYTNAVRHN